MDLIKWKLDKITSAWNHYFWEFKSLQGKINFNHEVKTNYFGEILSYFNDTFDLLYLNKSDKFSDNIFYYTGLLQIIYVQQDLMDELLHIFKIQKSHSVDKHPNREIRNELVGHPIRRNKKGNELISSVLFSNRTSNKTLEYLIYSKNNNFKMKVANYNTQTILDEHRAFLNKYFDIILKKIRTILSAYEKRISQFKSTLSNNIKFESIINQVEISFESFLKFDHLYKKEYLLNCYKRQNEHQRYKFVIEVFLKRLQNNLNETKKDIIDFIKETESNVPRKYFGPAEQPLLDEHVEIRIRGKKRISKNDFTYELGKLHEKSPVFTIDYFRDNFRSNKKILGELENMENHFNNDFEYYSSYTYLRKLIMKKKFDLD